MFVNLEAFKTSVQTARDNVKEISRIGVNSAKRNQEKLLLQQQQMSHHRYIVIQGIQGSIRMRKTRLQRRSYSLTQRRFQQLERVRGILTQ